MRKKSVTIFITLFLTISMFGSIFLAFSTPVVATQQPMPLLDRMPIDATPEMIGEKEVAMRKSAAEIGAAAATKASLLGNPAIIGEELVINVGDFVEGNYNETFVVLLDGTHGIICIEKAAYDNYDETTDEYVFPNPSGVWRDEDRISTAMLEYMLNEFDTNIYPTDTAIFGEPLPRGEEGQKVWILIHNIRDESYYPTPPGEDDPESYVAGYFSSAEDAENNKNMFHMDTYDWQNRIGPDSARPFVYEGTFAHEFQHLIHFDQDPDEPSWVDEACADMAMYLCGYGHPSGHIAYYFLRHFFTPLTFWGGGLEDYGASYLWALYMYDHFGGADFFTALVQEQANGIEGVENTLDTLGYWWIGFDEIFDRWTIANYMDEDPKHKKWGPSIYGYDSIEIGSEDTWGYTIEYWITDDNYYWHDALEYYFGIDVWPFPIYDAPFEVTEDDWSFWLYGFPMPYTAQYFRFTNDRFSEITFDGADTADVLPPSGSYEWYSGVGTWAWRSISQSFPIPATGNTNLNFKTYFDIEGDWDYGYVEVFDGTNWYTLDTPGTVDDLPNAQMNENCPDEREPITYEAAGLWHAFTGNSGGWQDITMDLTPFAGMDIELYFTTWQDGAFTLQMMYVDDIEIINDLSGQVFFDDVEAGIDGWDVGEDGWYITDGIYPNGWSFNVITTNNVDPAYPDGYPNTNDWKFIGRREMWINPTTQSGTMFISKTPSTTHKFNVAIVSNHADHIITSTYHFSVEKFTWNWNKWHHWWPHWC